MQRKPQAPAAQAIEILSLDKIAATRGGDAVVLAPAGLVGSPPGPVTVLLHLHGICTKRACYEDILRTRSVPPDYEVPAQLESFLSGRPGSRIIALLPIGKTVPAGKG